jgi:response regulator RpfG family c-di-GMP phosphodiesterase
MEQAATRSLQKTIEAMKVLVVDDEQYMRKVVRTMLLSMGVKIIYEAEDGHAGPSRFAGTSRTSSLSIGKCRGWTARRSSA